MSKICPEPLETITEHHEHDFTEIHSKEDALSIRSERNSLGGRSYKSARNESDNCVGSDQTVQDTHTKNSSRKASVVSAKSVKSGTSHKSQQSHRTTGSHKSIKSTKSQKLTVTLEEYPHGLVKELVDQTSKKMQSFESVHLRQISNIIFGELMHLSVQNINSCDKISLGTIIDRISQEFIYNLIEKKLEENEEKIRKDFVERFDRELKLLKEKFDMILKNEQVRTSCLLREAHRERHEKVAALKSQLECKNLAGLMYVLCRERRKCKVDTQIMINEYNEYIKSLREAIENGQRIIQELFRQCTVATKVDDEWRQKTKVLIKEYQKFLAYFIKGTPETSRFLLDMQSLLTIKTSLKPTPKDELFYDDTDEDYCSCLSDSKQPKTWVEKLTSDMVHKPFVVYGDMSDINTSDRRDILKKMKAENHLKRPDHIQEYVFESQKLLSVCPNFDSILAEAKAIEQDASTLESHTRNVSIDVNRRISYADPWWVNLNSMGSIVKLMTQNCVKKDGPGVLAAKDSMEIVSTTRLMRKLDDMNASRSRRITMENLEPDKIVVGKPKFSFCDEVNSEKVFSQKYIPEEEIELGICEDVHSVSNEEGKENDDDGRESTSEEDESSEETREEDVESIRLGKLGSLPQDSLTLLQKSLQNKTTEGRVGFEKMCPVKDCQRKRVNSLVNRLPLYMQYKSPFEVREQNYDNYELCNEEDLKKLAAMCEETSLHQESVELQPWAEWDLTHNGVTTQTSEIFHECCCTNLRAPANSKTSLTGRRHIYKPSNARPQKERLDSIPKERLFDSTVEFNRFRLESDEEGYTTSYAVKPTTEFLADRLAAIAGILKTHPSLRDMFQAETL